MKLEVALEILYDVYEPYRTMTSEQQVAFIYRVQGGSGMSEQGFEFRPTTVQQRMGLLTEFADAVYDTVRGGCLDHLDSEVVQGGAERALGVRWHGPDDPTVLLLVDGEPVMMLTLEVTVAARAYRDLRNEPTGDEQQLTWGTLPAGWFVKTPKGDWFEVASSVRNGGRQDVGLLIGGREQVFDRDPQDRITARPGTLTTEVADALHALRTGGLTAEVLRDGAEGGSCD